MYQHVAILILSLAMAAMAAPVHAQTERGGGDAQKFMQQYQQLSSEKTALQAQMAQMKKDLDSAQAELTGIRKERDALKARQGESAATLTQLTASKESADKSVEQYKQRLGEIVARYRETATTLKDVEADRALAHKALDERNAAFDQCAENNQQLYEIAGDILNRYEHVGLFTKAGAGEPFTKITRTRIENLVDETRSRAEELRIKKRGATP